MSRNLYFICPTDFLETAINGTFFQENFFLTSLGNNFSFDLETIGEINGFIETKRIEKITFVLSKDNRFFQGSDNRELQSMSIHLKEKIAEIKSLISKWLVNDIRINALIYNRKEQVFVEADPSLFRIEQYCHN